MIEVRISKDKLKPPKVFVIDKNGNEIEISDVVSYEEDARMYLPNNIASSRSKSIKIESRDYRIVYG